MRIVTRPDFDGVVCAVLLYEVHTIDDPILWAQPNDMQQDNVKIQAGDVIANLPYHQKCTLWFDHHISNKIETPFKGSFQILPSAARVIYDYYKDRIGNKFKDLIEAPPPPDQIFNLIFCTVAALISGYIAIIWLLDVIRKQKLEWFGIYCIIVSIVGLAIIYF